jgi:hypothetical protein
MDLRLRNLPVAILIAATILAACGGGSSNVVVPVPGLPLFTTAADTVSIAPGATTTFTVGGGGGKTSFTSYSVISSDTAVATAVLNGTSFAITGLAPGTATISVSDAAAASVTISVTVAGGTGTADPIPLYATAPANVTVAAGAVQKFGVAGGTGPYAVSSSNVTVAQPSLAANVLTIAGGSEGSAAISVLDAKGTSIAINVSVKLSPVRAPLQTTAASATTLALCTPSIFTISGGTAPYLATSTDLGIATPIIAGSLLSIVGTAPGAANIVVSDATGASVRIASTVAGTSIAVCTGASISNTVAAGGSSSFAIGGGTPPYVTPPSNSGAMTAAVYGTTLTISGLTNGSGQVTVKDAVGAIAPVVNVTVVGGSAATLFSSAPDSITVARDALAKYFVAGGLAPYMVASSNVLVAAAALSGNDLSISGGSKGGDATVVIHDARGDSISILVTVPAVP